MMIVCQKFPRSKSLPFLAIVSDCNRKEQRNTQIHIKNLKQTLYNRVCAVSHSASHMYHIPMYWKFPKCINIIWMFLLSESHTVIVFSEHLVLTCITIHFEHLNVIDDSDWYILPCTASDSSLIATYLYLLSVLFPPCLNSWILV